MASHAHEEWRRIAPALALLDRAVKPGWRDKLARVLRPCVWLYLLFVVIVWLLLRFAAERWWLATVMLFGPRWVYGLPLLPLVAGAVLLRRRLPWPLALGAIVVAWPIMGLCLPWGRAFAPDGPTVRVLTCNVAGEAATPEAIRKLVETVRPDMVALEECRGGASYQWPEGWHVVQHGELLVASRYPVQEIQEMDGRHPGHVSLRWTLLQCVVSTPDRDVDFCCIHLPTPREGIAAVLDRSTVVAPSRSGMIDEETYERRGQSEEIAGRVEDKSASVILAGDFNMPADSPIYRQAWGRYRNAFSTSGFGFGNTIRADVHGWRFGARIDHILTGPNWRPRHCWVGPDVGSDHLPLIADLVWIGGGDEPSRAPGRQDEQ